MLNILLKASAAAGVWWATMSCTIGPTASRVGATLDNSMIRILHNGDCHGAVNVESIVVFDLNGTRSKAFDDTIIWKVEAPIAVHVTDFTVGVQPSGFSLVQDLTQTIEGRLLTVNIARADGRVDSLTFEYSQLRNGMIRTQSKYFTEGEFFAKDPCDH